MKILYCSAGKLCLYISYVILLYLLLCSWRPARGQTPYSLQGRIVSAENQEPLVGASVLLKGTINGTSTDKNGYFAVTTAENKAILTASFIGYRSLDTLLQLPLKKELILTLQQDLTMLEEVKVSTGYWETSKRLSTGNISKVTAETIEKQPVTNVLQALQGRMPGVYLTQRSGVPGSGFNIQIRGRNSLRSDGNDPLYIIDGVAFPSVAVTSGIGSTVAPLLSPMNSLDPGSIESIEILKDADATAIYGSRGANGVVLITTKKGSARKTTVEVNINTGFGKVPHMMNLLNTKQYIQMRREAFRNDGVEMTPANAADLMLWDTTRYTNWQKELIGGTSEKRNLNVSLAGGGQHTNFQIRGAYLRETSVFPGNFSYKRGSLNFNLSHTSENNKLSAVLSAGYTFDRNKLPSEDLITYALQLPPNAPELYGKDQELNWENGTWANPLAMLRKIYKVDTRNLLANTLIKFELLPLLFLKASLGFNSLSTVETTTEPSSSFNPANQITGRVRFGDQGVVTWVAEPQIDYSLHFGKGKLSALVGVTMQGTVREGRNLFGTNYTNDALLEDIGSAPTVTVLSTVYSRYHYAAVYGRINFNWDGKYIINLTARRDGSSRFGAGNRFATFGAIGVAWIFSDEQFLKDSHLLSLGKIRGSFGSSGSDQIPDYGFMDTYSSVTAYQGNSMVPTRIANPYYGWEVNKKLEGGLDLGFLANRILLSTSWFLNRSSNQLTGEALPLTTGFATLQNNLPAKVGNAGVELELSTINIRKQRWTWTSTFNITSLRNKLIGYPDIESSSYRNTYQLGKSLFMTKKFHYSGVDPATGVYTFQDVDGDGISTGNPDRVALKAVGQDFYGGLENRLTYQGFDLSVFLQFVKQDSRNYLYSSAFSQVPGRMYNQPDIVMNRWQKSGDVTNVQKFTQSLTSAARIAYSNSRSDADNTVSDGSFIRLQNIMLSWNLPLKIHHHIKKCRFYLQGQNLLTLTGYKGYDPEIGTSSSLPPLRVVTLGTQITL